MTSDDPSKNPCLPLTDEELKILEELELEEKDPEWASRRALLEHGRRKVEAYYEENKDRLYEKFRIAERNEYAAKIAAEQGRAVRPYQKLKGWTEEQKKARKQEKDREAKQRQRQREAALKVRQKD